MFIAARRTVAALLALTLWTSASRSAPLGEKDLADQVCRQVSRLHPGALVEARLMSNERLRGRLATVDAEAFTLRPESAGGSARRATFAEVKSVRAVASRRAKIAGWIIGGALIGVAVCAFTIYLLIRHNE